MRNFEGKTIWITGASSGIGEALCKQLNYKGIHLILSSRNKEKLEILANSLSHCECTVIKMDLELPSSIHAAMEQLESHSLKVDLLINNGGISQRSNALETNEEIERRIMEINYFGNVLLGKLVAEKMIKSGGGHIAVMSSISGKFGFFLRSTYAASKHALHGFYESLRLENEKMGLKISMICPGKINTPISQNALSGDGNKHAQIDNNQRTGMPVDKCAKDILKGISKEKLEIYVGGKELKALRLKRLFPKLFHKFIRKQPAT